MSINQVSGSSQVALSSRINEENWGALQSIFANSEDTVLREAKKTALCVEGFMGQIQGHIATVWNENLELREKLTNLIAQLKVIEILHQEEIKALKENADFSKKNLDSMSQDTAESLRRSEEQAVAAFAEKSAALLENSLLGIASPFNSLNGYAFHDFTPATINHILSTTEPEALLGYLAKYIESVLNEPLPTTTHADALPNPKGFALGLERYLTFLQQNEGRFYDHQDEQFQRITEIGNQVLSFVKFVQTNTSVFHKVVANYLAAYDKLKPLVDQAFERKSRELRCSFGFQGSITDSVTTLSSVALKEPKSDVVLQANGPSYWSLLSSPPRLSEIGAAPEIKGFIHPAAYVAESLEMGKIELYLQLGDYWGHGILVFRLGDGTELQLGSFNLQEIHDPGYNSSKICEQSIRNYWRNAHVNRATAPDGVTRTDGSIIPQGQNGHITILPFDGKGNFFYPHIRVDQEMSKLQSRIDQELVRLRKEASSSIFSSPEYQKLIEEMESTIHVMKALGSVAGVPQNEMNRISSSLWTRDNLNRHLQQYNGAVGSSLFPLHAAEELTRISSSIRSCIPQAPAVNPFTEQVQSLVQRLGVLGAQYIEFKRMQEEKKVQKKAAEKEAISQKVGSLESRITGLRDQNAKLIELMQQLLKQQETSTK